jgi:hypothetical protein
MTVAHDDGGAAHAADGPTSPRQAAAAGKLRSIFSALSPSCAENVIPRHRLAMPSLDALRASPHRPLLVTPDPGEGGVVYDGRADPAAALPLNGPAFEVDGPLFKVRGGARWGRGGGGRRDAARRARRAPASAGQLAARHPRRAAAASPLDRPCPQSP